MVQEFSMDRVFVDKKPQPVEMEQVKINGCLNYLLDLIIELHEPEIVINLIDG